MQNTLFYANILSTNKHVNHTQLVMTNIAKLIESSFLEGRFTLQEAIKDLSTVELNWQIDVRAVTIGSSLLHIAGFNDLVCKAVLNEDLNSVVNNKYWFNKFKGGFQRELGIKVKLNKELKYYQDLLGKETIKTCKILQKITSPQLNREVFFYADGKELQSEGLQLFTCQELLHWIPLHDRYHRGQVTLLKWLARMDKKEILQ